MKYILLICSLMLLNNATAQDLRTVFKAIGSNSVKSLSDYIADDLEVCIGDEQDLYSKSEGIEVVTQFLTKINVKSCSQIHKGASKSKNSAYRVGKLKGANGEEYRVFVYYERKQIVELRFDKS